MGKKREKQAYCNDPRLARLGTHTGGQLPTGFSTVPSRTRPGASSYLDGHSQKKYASLELAWQTYLEKHLLGDGNTVSSSPVNRVEGKSEPEGQPVPATVDYERAPTLVKSPTQPTWEAWESRQMAGGMDKWQGLYTGARPWESQEAVFTAVAPPDVLQVPAAADPCTPASSSRVVEQAEHGWHLPVLPGPAASLPSTPARAQELEIVASPSVSAAGVGWDPLQMEQSGSEIARNAVPQAAPPEYVEEVSVAARPAGSEPFEDIPDDTRPPPSTMQQPPAAYIAAMESSQAQQPIAPDFMQQPPSTDAVYVQSSYPTDILPQPSSSSYAAAQSSQQVQAAPEGPLVVPPPASKHVMCLEAAGKGVVLGNVLKPPAPPAAKEIPAFVVTEKPEVQDSLCKTYEVVPVTTETPDALGVTKVVGIGAKVVGTAKGKAPAAQPKLTSASVSRMPSAGPANTSQGAATTGGHAYVRVVTSDTSSVAYSNASRAKVTSTSSGYPSQSASSRFSRTSLAPTPSYSGAPAATVISSGRYTGSMSASTAVAGGQPTVVGRPSMLQHSSSRRGSMY
eukprot:gnl/TRDRNA2_/TRDRNA2_173574_c0_seq1.p1 gnl/TRDRNA2_/TRDRNA2_173574_c0~~gnl/TRDRNA2_/TRDRNA2_173574_c0_seq1.p1  ORF type:complete len:566 (-),score=96.99 gnl/TRDRNA2_/TRDRNA2_173574_c0_seq1:150-1847(-)